MKLPKTKNTISQSLHMFPSGTTQAAIPPQPPGIVAFALRKWGPRECIKRDPRVNLKKNPKSLISDNIKSRFPNHQADSVNAWISSGPAVHIFSKRYTAVIFGSFHPGKERNKPLTKAKIKQPSPAAPGIIHFSEESAENPLKTEQCLSKPKSQT
ncbi:MAG: hypothetical protein R2828_29955 [Saprospiraceae bacterium]